MISSKTVAQKTQTESGRLTLKSVRLPEVRTRQVKQMWLRLPMRSCYQDIARLWWIVIIRSGGDEPFKYKSIWLSGCQVVRKIPVHVCRKDKTFFVIQKCFHKLPFKEHCFSSLFVI